MFVAKRFLRPSTLGRFNFGVYKSGDISMDLLLTLSMQEADKKYKNYNDLVDSLVDKEIIKNPLLIDSMKKLDRSCFVEKENLTSDNLYMDRPHSLGSGEDISAPMMQALAAEKLFPLIVQAAEKETDPIKVVDVGTGSGYLSFLLYDALTKHFAGNNQLNLTILGIDVQESFINKIHYRTAELVDKNILKPHPSIILKFAKREFFDFLGDVNMTGTENRIYNVGAAVDLQTWDALKYSASRRKGAVLSPVVQQDGEQNLMFYHNLDNIPFEESLMKVMFAVMKQPHKEGKVDPEIQKYFIEKTDDVDDASGTSKASAQSSESEKSTDEIGQQALDTLKAEMDEFENKIKNWSLERKARTQKPVSLRDMQNDPEISQILDKLNKHKRKFNALQKAIKSN